MRIALVNGSPKGKSSNSGVLLEKLKPLISEGNELSPYRVNVKPLKPEQYRELNEADVLVLAFPLYFDAVPSHLLRMMVEMEEFRQQKPGNPDLTVYALINNGFYEGHQCTIAADIVRNWCSRCGFRFGMAVGHGAGEMLSSLSRVPLGKGPMKNLGRALDQLSGAILTRSSRDSLFIQPNFPRIAWRLSATYSFWHPQAKKNGLRPKELRKQPFSGEL
ncbi:hypothetical protein C2I18_05085 [Paenibacillus sp. PK3_47]|uniref:NAD(P)H-dependent oxidoreductase n=1 Tax=Paenibacillus sp. PK3_47 TaxID=2072642 RepID=UPI00201D6607|nr:NAD(P)H-dependent oxidoreductase [Paenibacillus sp. PK3_47]UQZ32992.1 hypothetical protein C2I18_05085 [Paenibacillus sp. PK3_47]